MNIPEAYARLVETIQSGDAEGGVAEARRLVGAGHSLKDIFVYAVTPCLKDVGDRFSRLGQTILDLPR